MKRPFIRNARMKDYAEYIEVLGRTVSSVRVLLNKWRSVGRLLRMNGSPRGHCRVWSVVALRGVWAAQCRLDDLPQRSFLS